jgi:Cu-Zn family superoxide dismutase
MTTEVILRSSPARVGAATQLCLGLCAAAALVACGGAEPLQGVQAATPALESSEDCAHLSATASLRDANGVGVGQITFTSDGESTHVDVSAHLPVGQGGIHGMHIHANDKPENGDGCVADPAQPASTHFTSTDGHYSPAGDGHGHHDGDLPPLYFTEAGEASMRFLMDHMHLEDLVGRAVIVHAGSDNYGNIPIGDGPDQYTANSAAATEATAKTGNAGARIACGVIE